MQKGLLYPRDPGDGGLWEGDRRNMEKIFFSSEETGEKTPFYVLEQTRLGACDYLLVTDAPQGDAQCLILKETGAKGAPEAVYEILEDENELAAVTRLFEELLEDVEIQL